MFMLYVILFVVLLVGWWHWLMSTCCVFFLLRRRRSAVVSGIAPPISILKPLKGLDPDLYENLASFCRQDYPCFELLVGTRDADDPALSVVRKLQRDFPQTSIRSLVTPNLGLNPKSSTLNELVKQAKYNLVIFSDSDIRVGSDYLSCVAAPLRDRSIGVVTCLYRSKWSNTFASIFGALHVDLSFLPSAALASCLPGIRYASGATLAVRRDQLIAVGNYASIADYLADDFLICAKLQNAGFRLKLSDYVVTHVTDGDRPDEFWRRQVRWARTIRATTPLQYLGILFTLTTPCSILLLAASGGAGFAWWVLIGSMVQRWLAGWCVCGATGNRALRRHLLWLPLSDCLDGLIWVAGLLGRHIIWRGSVFRLGPGGRLSQVVATPSHNGTPARRFDVARSMVRRLDQHLRQRDGIFEYTNDADCIFRIAIVTARRQTFLADGTDIAPGERIVELHLWNEHIPITRRSNLVGWSHDLSRRARRSLTLLNGWLEAHRELGEIKAIFARSALSARGDAQVQRLAERLGFEFHGAVAPRGVAGRLHRAGENLLVRAIIWTFNSAANPGPLMGRERHALWMSRRALRFRCAQRAAGSTKTARAQETSNGMYRLRSHIAVSSSAATKSTS